MTHVCVHAAHRAFLGARVYINLLARMCAQNRNHNADAELRQVCQLPA
jgi:hypothetical protein